MELFRSQNHSVKSRLILLKVVYLLAPLSVMLRLDSIEDSERK